MDKKFRENNSIPLAREMICIKKYLDSNDIQIIGDTALKALSNPKSKGVNVEDDLPILTVSQKESFLKFMKYFIEVNGTPNVSLIDYYVKTYNYCNEEQLPIVDILALSNTKTPSRTSLKLIKEYKHLLSLAEIKGSSLKRKAIIKAVPSYSVISKLRAKHQFGEEN